MIYLGMGERSRAVLVIGAKLSGDAIGGLAG